MLYSDHLVPLPLDCPRGLWMTINDDFGVSGQVWNDGIGKYNAPYWNFEALFNLSELLNQENIKWVYPTIIYFI